MRDCEIQTILTGLIELKKRVPVIPYSEYQKTVLEDIRKETAAFLEEDGNLALSHEALHRQFTI